MKTLPIACLLAFVLSAIAEDAYWLTPRATGFSYTPSPTDWRDTNIYQLFTDRFADGDDTNNPRSQGWYVEGKNHPQNRNYHHGGDWKGLRNNLDYLSGMGVNAVWISGVQMNDQGRDASYTPYHMYHPTDFFRVDPVMGTFQDLKDLIDACHARGIYVILDVVINHTADKNGILDVNQDKQYFAWGNGNFGWWHTNRRHAWPFDDLQWFHTNGTINNWDSFPEYIYGQFKGTDDLATEKEHVKYWLGEAFKNLISATDCDGFRVDAIKHVDKDWCLKWADDMRRHAASLGKNDFILFGEYFTYDNGKLAEYVTPVGSFNSALFFPMSQTIKSVFVDGGWTGQLTQALGAKSQYGEGENRLVTFIDNHDVNRIGLYISPSGDAGRIQWVMRPALTFLYTATPVPCLYYGTEHGFNQGGHFNGSSRTTDNPDDGDWQREAMFDRGFQPGLAAGNQLARTDAPLYLHIKALNAARKSHPALTRGTFSERWQNGGAGPYAYSRVLQDQEALVALNTSDNPVSITPQVGKPNGTEFTNILNPSEKINVANGRLPVPLAGRDSKIFVAGSVARPSSLSLTSNATHFSVVYTPNDGVLKNSATPMQLGMALDGRAEIWESMTAGANGVWTFSRSFADITASLALAVRDSSAPAVQDRSNAWVYDATKFGQSTIGWIGLTSTWPAEGSITASTDLWVDTQSWPKGSAKGGKVVFTVDGGATWQEVPLAANGTGETNDKWNANLGKLPPGTSIKFAVQVVDANGISRWDNNAGQDFRRTIQYGTLAIAWMGGTYHWPTPGNITATSDLWINLESYPQGAGIGGELLYSTDNGTTWRNAKLNPAGTKSQNDLWNANLGTFPAGSIIRFVSKLVDTTNTPHWDNNGGVDFQALVNGPLSSLTTIANIRARGRITPAKPRLELKFSTNGSVEIEPAGHDATNTYRIEQSDNLTTWETLRTIPAGDAATVWSLLTSADTAGRSKKFFRVEAIGGATDRIYDNAPASFSVESNKDGAAAANLVFSTDGGSTWQRTSLLKTSSNSTIDLWATDVPGVAAGAQFRFAMELIDQQGRSHWANNEGRDYLAAVARPGQSDFEAPVATHSPAVTATAASSLAISLSATDNADASPLVFYTLDGSEPTPGSLRYTGPIVITDTFAGVDATIRYVAVDADGNRSAAGKVEVRVGQAVSFGPLKPYSTNPSLGQAAGMPIVLDGANTANEWNDQNLVALGMANDDPRSLGNNWTMHEAPINLTHLWAAWDDSFLYLAWQFVDVTDIVDPANAGGAGSGRIGSNDGILQWIALDTKSNAGASKDVWKKNKDQPLWNGAPKPDFQIYLAGSLWQGYVSRAVNGVFPVDDGGVNYFKIADAGIIASKGAHFAGNSLWGVQDADDRRRTDAPTRNFLTLGHNQARDSFYEMKIPLSFLGLTRASLESQGLGVMIGAGSASPMDVLPQDDAATLDTPGVESYNSPFEWADTDSITSPFARVGAW